MILLPSGFELDQKEKNRENNMLHLNVGSHPNPGLATYKICEKKLTRFFRNNSHWFSINFTSLAVLFKMCFPLQSLRRIALESVGSSLCVGGYLERPCPKR